MAENASQEKHYYWIDYLRVVACILVVLLHATTTWTDSHPLEPYTARWWIDDVIIRGIVRIAVPCFIMISGALILNPNKDIPLKKLKNYLVRMLGILLIFGYGFCLIESFAANGIKISTFYTALINLLQELSWAHMWYVYMLIGLYILTPILRGFTKTTDKKTFQFTLLLLFLFSSVVPTINQFYNTSFTTFGLEYTIWVFYYLLGSYLFQYGTRHYKSLLVAGFLSLAVILLTYSLGNPTGNSYVWPSTILLSALLFVSFSSGKIRTAKNNQFVNLISKYSLGIYTIHAFFIHVIYKILHFNLENSPIFVGEASVFFSVFLLSLGSCFILYRMPVFRRILH